MIQRLVALMAIVIMLMAGVGALQAGYRTSVQGSQPATDVVNESWTVDEGNVSQLNHTGEDVVFNKSVTVTQGGSVIEQPNNYSWIDANGSIKALSGSALDDGQTAEIDYQYTEPTREQRVARDIGQIPVGMLGGDVVFILGIAVVLGATVIIARMGGA